MLSQTERKGVPGLRHQRRRGQFMGRWEEQMFAKQMPCDMET